MPAFGVDGSRFARTITGLAGYFRPRPDPSLEALLREAFEKFDRDLEVACLSGCDRPHTAPVPAAEQAGAQGWSWDRHRA